MQQMKFGPKRCSAVFIFENFIADFGLLILAVVLFLILGNLPAIMDNVVAAAIIVLSPFTRIVTYLSTTYEIDDQKLIVKSGWLNKSHLEIPLSSITTVDSTQNIVHRIFGVYGLHVDNSSNISKSDTRIKMTFNRQDTNLVKDLLTKHTGSIDGINIVANDYEQTSGDIAKTTLPLTSIMLMGGLNSKLLFLMLLLSFFASMPSVILSMFGVSASDIAAWSERFLTKDTIILTILVAIIALCIFSTVYGIIGAVIKYYNFTIVDDGEKIKIKYGLITKKSYAIGKKKISGFYYDQSVLMRLFKIGILRAIAIGYGNDGDEESSEDPLLFPIIPESRLTEAMTNILPEMAAREKFTRVKPQNMYYFFFSLSLAFSIILTGVLFWIKASSRSTEYIWIIGIFLIVFSIMSILLQYKNTGIYANDRHIAMSGGGFRKQTVFVKTNNVESVSDIANKLKRKKGVVTLSIGFIAPLTISNQKVKNVSVECFEQIKNKLVF